MATKQTIGLVFKHYEIDGGNSVHFGLGGNCRGIYAYHFNDGTWYVGKSIDMAVRFTQHLHEYRHSIKQMPTISDAWFAEIKSKEPSVLDEMETKAIHYFEDYGYDLRNKAKTQLPQGPNDAIVILEGNIGIKLPWNRSEKPSSSRHYVRNDSDITKNQRKRFERLMRHPAWDQIAQILIHYINATIPDPAATAGKLWSLSAYPSGRYGSTRRLCTLTIQNLETLVIGWTDDDKIFSFLNMKQPDKYSNVIKGLIKADYSAASNVYTDYSNNLDFILEDIENEVIQDWCYRLNVELMRKGGCMVRHSNNPLLVQAILERPLGK
jgi:predicted GIY-YIG superfamily endonuclease